MLKRVIILLILIGLSIGSCYISWLMVIAIEDYPDGYTAIGLLIPIAVIVGKFLKKKG